MYHVEKCLVCGTLERTVVCEHNRLIFIDSMWDNDLARYDYALCHGCGIVYATRRPDREEYEFLYANFNEFLLRQTRVDSMNSPTLNDTLKAKIDRDFLHWSKLEKDGNDRVAIHNMLRNELRHAVEYIRYIKPHVRLKGGKLLHIRAKSSTLADYLRTKFGLSAASLITLFPGHKYLAEKNPDVKAERALDYENFEIPFDETFDLIVENHIFIHMMDADKTFGVFLSHLTQDGSLFLENELADDRLFAKRKNLFAELRPFHFQQFDLPTIKRMLGRYGFRPVSVVNNPSRKRSDVLGVAKRAGPPGPVERIGAEALKQRLDMYAMWRDESILSLPKERAHALFAGELPSVWERVRASGRLTPNERSQLPAARVFAEADIPDAALEIGDLLKNLPPPPPPPSLPAYRLAAQQLAATGIGRIAVKWLQDRGLKEPPSKRRKKKRTRAREEARQAG